MIKLLVLAAVVYGLYLAYKWYQASKAKVVADVAAVEKKAEAVVTDVEKKV